jgi:hypothetical protein
MFDAVNFLNLSFFECFKRFLILKVNCLLFRIGGKVAYAVRGQSLQRGASAQKDGRSVL